VYPLPSNGPDIVNGFTGRCLEMSCHIILIYAVSSVLIVLICCDGDEKLIDTVRTVAPYKQLSPQGVIYAGQ
jgi:hypothetical protein